MVLKNKTNDITNINVNKLLLKVLIHLPLLRNDFIYICENERLNNVIYIGEKLYKNINLDPDNIFSINLHDTNLYNFSNLKTDIIVCEFNDVIQAGKKFLIKKIPRIKDYKYDIKFFQEREIRLIINHILIGYNVPFFLYTYLIGKEYNFKLYNTDIFFIEHKINRKLFSLDFEFLNNLRKTDCKKFWSYFLQILCALSLLHTNYIIYNDNFCKISIEKLNESIFFDFYDYEESKVFQIPLVEDLIILNNFENSFCFNIAFQSLGGTPVIEKTFNTDNILKYEKISIQFKKDYFNTCKLYSKSPLDYLSCLKKSNYNYFYIANTINGEKSFFPKHNVNFSAFVIEEFKIDLKNIQTLFFNKIILDTYIISKLLEFSYEQMLKETNFTNIKILKKNEIEKNKLKKNEIENYEVFYKAKKNYRLISETFSIKT